MSKKENWIPNPSAPKLYGFLSTILNLSLFKHRGKKKIPTVTAPYKHEVCLSPLKHIYAKNRAVDYLPEISITFYKFYIIRGSWFFFKMQRERVQKNALLCKSAVIYFIPWHVIAYQSVWFCVLQQAVFVWSISDLVLRRASCVLKRRIRTVWTLCHGIFNCSGRQVQRWHVRIISEVHSFQQS